MLPFPFAELTAAGTVQDFHLFPSQGFTTETLHHFAAAKIHFFSDRKHPRMNSLSVSDNGKK
jgi:hypothetical protein